MASQISAPAPDFNQRFFESESFVASLPVVPVESLPSVDRTCSICFSPYQNRVFLSASLDLPAEVPLSLPCGHVLGRECISTWLTSHETCPICRRQLIQHHRPAPVPRHLITSHPVRALEQALSARDQGRNGQTGTAQPGGPRRRNALVGDYRAWLMERPLHEVLGPRERHLPRREEIRDPHPRRAPERTTDQPRRAVAPSTEHLTLREVLGPRERHLPRREEIRVPPLRRAAVPSNQGTIDQPRRPGETPTEQLRRMPSFGRDPERTRQEARAGTPDPRRRPRIIESSNANTETFAASDYEGALRSGTTVAPTRRPRQNASTIEPPYPFSANDTTPRTGGSSGRATSGRRAVNPRTEAPLTRSMSRRSNVPLNPGL